MSPLFALDRLDDALAMRFVAEGTTKGVALLTAFALARFLQVDGFGGYSQTIALVASLTPIVLLGLGFALIRQTAGATTSEEIGSAVTTAFLIVSIMTMIVALPLWILAPSLASLYSDHPSAPSLMRAAAVLLPVAAWLTLVFETLRARHRTRSATVLQIGDAASSLAGVYVLYSTGILTPVSAIQMFAVLKAVVLVVAILDILRAERIGLQQLVPLSPARTRYALGLGLPFMVAGFGEVLMGVSDRVLVGSIGGADLVGRYVAAQTLVSILASWGAPYWWLLYPRMTRAFAQKSQLAAVAETRQLFGHFLLLAVPLAGILAWAGSALLILAVGDTFAVSRLTMAILVLAVLVNHMATPWEYCLYVYEKAVFVMVATLMWGALAIGGIAVLLSGFGLVGAALAVALARIGFALTVMLKAREYGTGHGLVPLGLMARVLGGVVVGGLAAQAVVPILGETHAAFFQAAVFIAGYFVAERAIAVLQVWRRAP